MLTVGANEAESEDRGQKSGVQRDSVHVGQLLIEVAAVEKQKEEPMDTGVQVTEESEPVVIMDETEPADEEIPAECILLCIEGCFNGLPVKFLIDCCKRSGVVGPYRSNQIHAIHLCRSFYAVCYLLQLFPVIGALQWPPNTGLLPSR